VIYEICADAGTGIWYPGTAICRGASGIVTHLWFRVCGCKSEYMSPIKCRIIEEWNENHCWLREHVIGRSADWQLSLQRNWFSLYGWVVVFCNLAVCVQSVFLFPSDDVESIPPIERSSNHSMLVKMNWRPRDSAYWSTGAGPALKFQDHTDTKALSTCGRHLCSKSVSSSASVDGQVFSGILCTLTLSCRSLRNHFWSLRWSVWSGNDLNRRP